MSSPLEIAIALHYWTQQRDYAADNPEHANSSAVRESIQSMVDASLLKTNPSYPPADVAYPPSVAKYLRTEALRVYVEALCSVRWPVSRQVWVIPEDEIRLRKEHT